MSNAFCVKRPHILELLPSALKIGEAVPGMSAIFLDFFITLGTWLPGGRVAESNLAKLCR